MPPQRHRHLSRRRHVSWSCRSRPLRANRGVTGSGRGRPSLFLTVFSRLGFPLCAAARGGRGYWLGEGAAVILSDSLLALGLPVMRRDERRHSFELLRVPVVAG